MKLHAARFRVRTITEAGPGWTKSTMSKVAVPACGQVGGKVADTPKEVTCLKCRLVHSPAPGGAP